MAHTNHLQPPSPKPTHPLLPPPPPQLARRALQAIALWRVHCHRASDIAGSLGRRALMRRAFDRWQEWPGVASDAALAFRDRNLAASAMLGWALWMHYRRVTVYV